MSPTECVFVPENGTIWIWSSDTTLATLFYHVYIDDDDGGGIVVDDHTACIRLSMNMKITEEKKIGNIFIATN